MFSLASMVQEVLASPGALILVPLLSLLVLAAHLRENRRSPPKPGRTRELLSFITPWLKVKYKKEYVPLDPPEGITTLDVLEGQERKAPRLHQESPDAPPPEESAMG